MGVLVASHYPETTHDFSQGEDFATKEERERLSASAIKAFFKIMTCWKIRDEEARVLLGGVSNGPYYTLKREQRKALGPDVLTRISFLIGIFKGLNTIYGEKLADEWIQLPNLNRIFGGRTPLQYMTQGGIPAMQIVRRLIDARLSGV